MGIVSQSVFKTSTSIIVVPCFNEAARLQLSEFLRFAKRNAHVQFQFVDDGSTDQTTRLLDSIRTDQPDRFRLISLPANQGKAEAVRLGLLEALQHDPDYVGYWDADLATPLQEIDRFVATLDRLPAVDVVLGSRVPLLGRKITRSFMRSALSRCFSLAASMALGCRVRDTQCGAKLFRVSSPLTIALSEPFISCWIFDVELLARLIALHATSPACTLYENPLDSWKEVEGSKLRPKHFVRAIAEWIAIYWRYSGTRLQKYCNQAKSLSLQRTLPTEFAPQKTRAKAA
jgi:glycosyltransferase involved in cell wall biosynthesis